MCVFWVFKTDYLPFYCFDLIFVFVLFFLFSSLFSFRVCVRFLSIEISCCTDCVRIFASSFPPNETTFIHSLPLLLIPCVCVCVCVHFSSFNPLFWLYFFLLHCFWLSLFLLLTITVLRIQFRRIEKKNLFKNSMAQHIKRSHSLSHSISTNATLNEISLYAFYVSIESSVLLTIFSPKWLLSFVESFVLELRERMLLLLLWFYFIFFSVKMRLTHFTRISILLCVAMCFSSFNRLNSNEIDWLWWTVKGASTSGESLWKTRSGIARWRRVRFDRPQIQYWTTATKWDQKSIDKIMCIFFLLL